MYGFRVTSGVSKCLYVQAMVANGNGGAIYVRNKNDHVVHPLAAGASTQRLDNCVSQPARQTNRQTA